MIEQLLIKLGVVKVFKYRYQGHSWNICSDHFINFWNPLTWIVLLLVVPIAVVAVTAKGIAADVAASWAKDRRARNRFIEAKEKGWLKEAE